MASSGAGRPGPSGIPRISASEHRRRRTVWESVLGFLVVFDVIALVQAVVNVLGDAEVWPSLLLAVLLALTWAAWRRWRTYRD